jgi:hypothetical protein
VHILLRVIIQNMEFTLGSIHKDDDGIVWMKFKKDTQFEKDHIDELFALWEKVTQGEKCPFIIDLRTSYASIPADFLQLMSLDSRAGKWKKAEAILIDSLSLRLMANFYKKLDSNPIPIEVFTNEEEAIKWVCQF